MAFEIEFTPSAERHGANEMKFLFLWGGHIFNTDHLFINAGVKFETENGENDSKRTFLYNMAYLTDLKEDRLIGAIEANAKVNAGRTGDRTVLTLRPQLIWQPSSRDYAVKFGVGFGMTHRDPERDGSFLISRLF